MRASRPVLATAVVCGLLIPMAPAHAELAKWDQAKVTELAKSLAEATNALYDTFYKQPPPSRGSMQARSYQQLRHKVRVLQREARALAGALEKGEDYEETLPSYDSLMELVRSARRDSQRVFTTTDVQQKASAARQILNELTPYYDPDAEPLAAAAR